MPTFQRLEEAVFEDIRISAGVLLIRPVDLLF